MGRTAESLDDLLLLLAYAAFIALHRVAPRLAAVTAVVLAVLAALGGLPGVPAGARASAAERLLRAVTVGLVCGVGERGRAAGPRARARRGRRTVLIEAAVLLR
ncbi:MAG: hypothetical protein M3P46_02950 [Actinomycetota bacterium]|nr:hypothetical protein [Actinomycetota bacterium]